MVATTVSSQSWGRICYKFDSMYILQSSIGDHLLPSKLLHFFRIALLRDMPTLIITVDLECCRCSSQIQKILCCIQERREFVIDKIVYERDKVIVSGPFDADKLSCKLCCKAGRIIKSIEVVKPPPPPPPKTDDPKPKPKPKPEPEPAPCKLIPYLYPYPYPGPQPAWPCNCPTPYCQCHAKPPAPAAPAPPPAPPPPAPGPPKPPACGPSCHCCGYPPPAYMPPPMPYPMVFCEESPPYGACTVM